MWVLVWVIKGLLALVGVLALGGVVAPGFRADIALLTSVCALGFFAVIHTLEEASVNRGELIKLAVVDLAARIDALRK